LENPAYSEFQEIKWLQV